MNKPIIAKINDKFETFRKLLAETGLGTGQCAYMGDDLVDLPVMRRVAFAVAVPDSPELVRSHADYVTRSH